MEPRNQYEIYTTFCNLMSWYSKDMSLSMADNEIARRYTSSVAKLRRYLVQRFANCGFNDVEAHYAIDEKTGVFLVKNPEYNWINRYSYPEIGELEDEVKKLYNASNNCHWDTYKVAISVADFVEETISNLEKYNYRISAEIKRKVEIVISNRELAHRCISGTFGNVISIENGEYTNIDLEMRNRRRLFWDFVSDVFNYFYRYFKQRDDEVTFYKIFETAHLNTRYGGKISIEESLKETYKLFKVPANPNYYINFEYTTLESVNPIVKSKTTMIKTKNETTPKTKKEVVKEATTKKVNDVKSTPKPEVVNPIVIEQKVNVVEEVALNVLDISKYTKLANGYRIDRVENKAKKIIVDDRVVEFNSLAFLECYKLEEITIGKNVRAIKFGQFSNLKNLIKVTFSEGLCNIDNNAFENTNLQGIIDLPSSLLTIGKKAFNVINPNILTINVSKFTCYCDNSFHNLSKVYIEGKLKGKAEEVVKKEEIAIDKTTFTKEEFSSPMIDYVDKPFDLEVIKSYDDCDDAYAFIRSYDDEGRCLAYSVTEGHEVMIVSKPIQVVEFEKYFSFEEEEEAYKIRKLILSDDVEEISSSNSFYSFVNLQELVLPNNSKFTKLPKRMFTKVNNKITHLEIPNCVKDIDPNCFENSNILYLTIGKDVDISKVNFPHKVKIYRKKY